MQERTFKILQLKIFVSSFITLDNKESFKQTGRIGWLIFLQTKPFLCFTHWPFWKTLAAFFFSPPTDGFF
jgi:hypothetical protein